MSVRRSESHDPGSNPVTGAMNFVKFFFNMICQCVICQCVTVRNGTYVLFLYVLMSIIILI